MSKSCPNCGTITSPEVRFCRRCGKAFRALASDDEAHRHVSPISATVPLSEEGRITEGFTGDDLWPGAHETTKINRVDLDAILRPSTPTAPPYNLDATAAQAEQEIATDEQPFDDEDEDLTITVARPERPATPAFGVAAPSAATSAVEAAGKSNRAVVVEVPPAHTSAPNVTKRRTRKAWLVGVIIGVALLGFTAAAVLLGVNYLRRPVMVESTGAPSPIPVADPKQLFDEKVAEAEALLASGEMDKAIAALREANRLDPSNTKARWRLGDILMESGGRGEAIEEYRAITRNDPNDRAAWRVLAAALFAENSYSEAVESYRRFFALTGEADQDPRDLLAYADAMRLAGLADEAGALYQKLSSSPTAEVASEARARLAELAADSTTQPSASPQPTHDGGRTRDIRESEEDAASGGPEVSAVISASATPTLTPAPAPAPTANPASLSPAERYSRGVELWSSNRAAAVTEFHAAAKGVPDAYYYLGLSIAEGRDPRTLKRAELVAAMSYFQAARRGRFSAQAQRYEAQLGKEYARRRNE